MISSNGFYTLLKTIDPSQFPADYGIFHVQDPVI